MLSIGRSNPYKSFRHVAWAYTRFNASMYAICLDVCYLLTIDLCSFQALKDFLIKNCYGYSTLLIFQLTMYVKAMIIPYFIIHTLY